MKHFLNSSFLYAATWTANTRGSDQGTLRFWFAVSRRVYDYHNVPKHVFVMLQFVNECSKSDLYDNPAMRPSVGAFYNRFVKGQYACIRRHTRKFHIPASHARVHH